MKRFFDDLKPVESDKLDLLAAEFFYGYNIPFNAADSIYFKKFINALRPAYNPPNRRQLAGNLLNKTYDKMEMRNSENKRVTLLLDGWKNSSANRHYVVAMLATSNDEKVILETFDFSSVRETTLNLIEASNKAIAKERYDATVYAILTDNAFNMQGMGAANQMMCFIQHAMRTLRTY